MKAIITKSVKHFLTNFTFTKNPAGKNLSLEKTSQSLFKVLTLRRLVIYGLLSNTIGLAYYINKYNINNYNLSLSRLMSRITGRLMDTTVPVFLRKLVYSFYIWFYGVTRDDILEQDLTQYRCLKDFFIRKIKVNRFY
jgi:hypothetical protein